MRILILGGTAFAGRAFTGFALDAGHDVTVLHRGQTNTGLFPEAEEILADRDGGMSAIGERTWDAVVDMCGYFPRVVGQSVEHLREKTSLYLFISSISVYADPSSQVLTEDSPVATIRDPQVEEITGETYGALKALCEDIVRSLGDKALIVRPGLIVGPWDRSDRFTYWPVRFAEGGDILVPDRLEQPNQFIDARDLAAWMLRLVENQVSGTFNAVGPATPMTMGEFYERAKQALNPSARIVTVPVDLLQQEKVEPWSDLPLVLPYEGLDDGMSRADNSRAMAEGLRFRSLEETLKDTLAWVRSERPAGPFKVGLTRERETEVLRKASSAPR